MLWGLHLPPAYYTKLMANLRDFLKQAKKSTNENCGRKQIQQKDLEIHEGCHISTKHCLTLSSAKLLHLYTTCILYGLTKVGSFVAEMYLFIHNTLLHSASGY